MAEIDVLKAQLVREDFNVPWGFRLQGGVDTNTPLSIARIRPGSPASRIGLRQGDEVTEIDVYPTASLTHQAANDLIRQYGLSLILTVERRARGAAPVAPTVLHSTAPPHLASYQTYDMTGKPGGGQYAAVRSAPHARPAPTYPNIDYQTATARVYDPPPMKGPRYQPPPPKPVEEQYGPPQSNNMSAVDGGYGYIPEEDKLEEGPVQSRTFKILQSLMQNEDYKKASGPTRQPTQRTVQQYLHDEPMYAGNPVQSRSFQALSSNVLPYEEPYAGSAGLPPPRSASMEQWKQEQAAKRESPRVQVFMPQSYNTPLGLYNTENIMDSFQQQAGAHLDQLDGYEEDPLSGAQRAVMEDEVAAGGASDL